MVGEDDVCHPSMAINKGVCLSIFLNLCCIFAPSPIGVKPDWIRTDNLHTVSYSIFIFRFGSGTDADSNIGLCGFEYRIRRIRKRYGNGNSSDRKRTFTIFICKKYINALN